MMLVLLIAATLLACAGPATTALAPWKTSAAALADAREATARLASARRLVVQLQDVSFEGIERADPDVVVVDYSWDGGARRELTAADVNRLRSGARGRRVVLAYLSIGEAESYRYYWRDRADRGRATFVVGRNPSWAGNYRVRYWDEAWHDILYGRDSYLGRIVAQGFDGVYLDTIDTADFYAAQGDSQAVPRMAELVRAVAKAGHALRPGFLVLAQNAFGILEEPGVREALAGIVVENHLFPAGRRPDPASTEAILSEMRGLRAAGKPVLVVEYAKDSGTQDALRRLCAENGFLCYLGTRSLGRIGQVIDSDPGNGG